MCGVNGRFDQLVEENDYQPTDKEYLSDSNRVTDISKSFAYKMAAKSSWHMKRN